MERGVELQKKEIDQVSFYESRRMHVVSSLEWGEILCQSLNELLRRKLEIDEKKLEVEFQLKIYCPLPLPIKR